MLNKKNIDFLRNNWGVWAEDSLGPSRGEFRVAPFGGHLRKPPPRESQFLNMEFLNI